MAIANEEIVLNDANEISGLLEQLKSFLSNPIDTVGYLADTAELFLVFFESKLSKPAFQAALARRLG